MLNRLTIFISILGLFLPLSYVSAGTVLSSHKYAWSNNVGYINFANVIVNDSALSGSAWSAKSGWIKFDPAQGGVLNNGSGNLSGSAWGEQLGWIDFNNVAIDPTTGKFSGTATGALVGTITFDCPNYCDVRTDWRQITAPVTPAPIAPSNGGGGGGGIISHAGVTVINEPIPIIISDVLNKPLDNTSTTEKTPRVALVADRNGVVSISPGEQIPVTTSTEKPPLFDIISEPTNTRVAPGELLPISVKLSNFGGGKRVDVLITYSIVSSQGKEIYSTNETVAVETTANFVKTIQIPFATIPGTYTAKTSITYIGQLVPATTEFPFTVERKILGLFQSDFLLYGGITVFVSGLATLFGYVLIKRRRQGRYNPFDYFDKPKDERIYYEIVSDTIGQMRQRAGDNALEVATHTAGLAIDEKTGRVLKITDSPAKVVAELVSGYEKLLGKKVSFSFRREKTDL